MQQELGSSAPVISDIAIAGAVCGDGASDGVSEECDLGNGFNNEYSSCSSTCMCNQDSGFEFDNTTGTCTCSADVDFEVTVEEDSRLQSEDNTITVNLFFRSDVDAAESEPSMDAGPTRMSQVAVVTITGLAGSLTPDTDELDITCPGGPPGSSGCMQVGLQPQSPGAGPVIWRTGKGQWAQESGTLTFTVINAQSANTRACRNNEQPCDYTQSPSLALSFVIKNRGEAQDAIHPTVRVCHRTPLVALEDDSDYTSPIFASNEVDMTTASQDMNKYLESWDEVVTAATVALDSQTDVRLTLGETTEFRDISFTELDKLPQGAAFAGIGNSFLNIDLKQAASISGSVSLAVDMDIVKQHGGCYLPEDYRLRVCVSGWTGLYRFNENSERWEDQTDVTAGNKYNEIVQQTVSESSTLSDWAVLATMPCCDYEGNGRACGDRVCMEETPTGTDLENVVNVAGLLGDLTVSKMPSVRGSTRPKLANANDLQSYLNPTEAIYSTRSPWTKVAPSTTATDCLGYSTSEITWIPPRFYHAAEKASSTRILIYGGIGCMTYVDQVVPGPDGVDVTCKVCSLLMPLNDLWELDVLKVGTDQRPFTLMEVSPSLDPLLGGTSVTLPSSDHKILIFGGSSVAYVLDLLFGTVGVPSFEEFEYRDLEFRSRKASRMSFAGVSGLSSHSEVANSSMVILFGGFVRNTLTSAVYTYNLASASPSLGLSKFAVLAEAPPARSFPGVVKPNDVLLLMFGGTQNSDTINHEGNSQMWELDLTTQKWSVVHEDGLPTTPDPAAFFAFTNIADGSGSVLLLMHGGLAEGFNVTKTFQFSPSANEDFEDLHQPSNTIRLWFFDSYGTDEADNWWTVYSLQGTTEAECCIPGDPNRPAYCGAAPIYGCEQPGRAMHTVQPGTFSAGLDSIMLFGGVGRYGDALSDLWYHDASDPGVGFPVQLTFTGITAEEFLNDEGSFRSLVEASFTFTDGDCPASDFWTPVLCAPGGRPPCGRREGKQIYGIDAVEDGTGNTVVTFAATAGAYYGCIAPLLGAPSIWERARQDLDNKTALFAASFVDDGQFPMDLATTTPVALLIQWYQYDDTDGCRTGESVRSFLETSFLCLN